MAAKKAPKNSKETVFDVIIIGGGLAGMSLSCLLGTSGLKIACIDQGAPARTPTSKAEKPPAIDLRTTAISYGSSKILARAGVWEDIKNQSCPIQDIQILDGDSPILLNFFAHDIDTADNDDKAFGWIGENADLLKILKHKIDSLKTVTHITPAKALDFEIAENQTKVTLDNGTTLSAQLIIGADGRQSSVRAWMDIPTRQWSYNQRAVICCVEHENPHHNIAVEHFWPEGPFAILPMADTTKGKKKVFRSSVVFTEHGPRKNSLMHFSDDAFETALNTRFPDSYGTVQLASQRAAYPLNLIHASRYIGPRMALVADAAHGIHPIAGQGLNLGFRDIGEIATLLENAFHNNEDLGSQDLLETYQRKRRFDNMQMVAVTDGLVRLFSNRLPPVRFLRRTGLKLVEKLGPAKRFFMKQAMGDF